MFNDVAGGKQIDEFVGLRAKLYYYKMLDDSEDKKCKRMSINVTNRSIQFDDYRECLFSRRNKIEKLMSYEVIVMRFIPKKLIKFLLSSGDDKRVIVADGLYTLAYGHTNFKKFKLENELH